MTAALERVRAQGGRLLVALERSGVALVVADPKSPDNPVVLANKAFTRLTGYSSQEAIGRNCRFMQGPRTDAGEVAKLKASIDAGEDVQADLLNQRKDRTLFWNRVTVTVVRDDAGAPLLLIATMADVTPEHGRGVLAGAAGIWEWDVPAQRLYGDARFAELYGLEPRSAFLGLTTSAFFSSIDPADRMRVRIAVAGAMNGVETFTKNFRLTQPDGTTRWVSARGRPHFDHNGKTILFTGVLTDVTEQKRVEEKLRIAQNAGGIGSFEYICGFATASVSDQFCRLLGINSSDTLSVRTINAVVEKDSPAIIDFWDQAEPKSLPYTEIAIRNATSGKPQWIARRGDLILEPAGIRFIGVIYDVTASKLAENKLRHLSETLEDMVKERTRERDLVWNLSSDILAVTGPGGLLKTANPALTVILGYTPEELIGTSIRDLAHPEDAEAAAVCFNQTTINRAPADFDCRSLAKDGEYRWINWNAVAHEDEIVEVGRDITQRKQLEEQLRQSHKMEAVGQLTGGLAHDFNNMLTGIIGSLDIVKRRLAQGRTDDLEKFINAAHASGGRAAALIHRLLAFSRRQSLDFRAVDVNALVADMADLLSRTLGEQITLQVDLDPMVAPAASDRNQLESAVLNLAINARDAMPNGGQLIIKTACKTFVGDRYPDVAPGDYVELRVSDTGFGMPPDVLAKAFDPFFTTKPQGQGTGLGLSMIYGFVRQTGGHVEIGSEAGCGATIHLYLPRFSGNSEVARTAPDFSEVAHGAGEVVLVVEDDPSVRMLVMELIRDLGYNAIEFSEADGALQILKSAQAVDLLITDVGLPGMDGRRLAHIARDLRPGLRVLFMTGYAEKATIRSEFLEPGMRMITKPFAIGSMAAEVRSVLAS